MKKALSLLLALVLCLTLTACGGENTEKDSTSETTGAVTSLKITSEMQKEIEKEIEGTSFRVALIGWIRIISDGYEFTDIKITKYELVDQYTYVVHGVLYTEDDYGGTFKDNIDITFTAEEDPSDSRGYKFEWDIDMK